MFQDENISIRNQVYSSHQRLRDPDSDALSALNALLAFDAEPQSEGDAFCRRNFLHAGHLREMSALRAQLLRVVSVQAHAHESWATLQTILGSLSPEAMLAFSKIPSKETRKALSCCVAAGWADQVAKRVRSREQLHNSAAKVCRQNHACCAPMWLDM